MKVFLITTGDYSAYHVVAICSTKEKAQRIADLTNSHVEEKELDPEIVDPHPGMVLWEVTLLPNEYVEWAKKVLDFYKNLDQVTRRYYQYAIDNGCDFPRRIGIDLDDLLDKDGSYDYPKSRYSSGYWSGDYSIEVPVRMVTIVTIWARDEEHCVKIAGEKRAEWLVELKLQRSLEQVEIVTDNVIKKKQPKLKKEQ